MTPRRLRHDPWSFTTSLGIRSRYSSRVTSRRNGFEVTHLFCASFQTPHGDIGGTEGARFRSAGIELRRSFAKYSAGRRALQELEYGWRLSRAVSERSPQLVVSANTPLLAALVFHLAMRLRRIPVIFWMQDVYSEAMAAHLRRRGGSLARALAWAMGRVERWIARSSERVVVISDAFVGTLRDWGVPSGRIDVVENWAPLEEVPNGADRTRGPSAMPSTPVTWCCCTPARSG